MHASTEADCSAHWHGAMVQATPVWPPRTAACPSVHTSNTVAPPLLNPQLFHEFAPTALYKDTRAAVLAPLYPDQAATAAAAPVAPATPAHGSS